MSYSAVNSIQACGDTLSTLTPKPPSPSMTTTGRSRPNRLCFRRTLSCSAMGAKANRCKNNQSVLSKQPAINVISEESSNISEDVFTSTNETNTNEKCCSTLKTLDAGRVEIKEPTMFQKSPKKSSESNYSLPVISVHLSAFPFDLFGELFVDFGFAVGLALSFTFLSHKHLPPSHIIHGLILVRQ